MPCLRRSMLYYKSLKHRKCDMTDIKERLKAYAEFTDAEGWYTEARLYL
jgi:hypothetical protein